MLEDSRKQARRMQDGGRICNRANRADGVAAPAGAGALARVFRRRYNTPMDPQDHANSEGNGVEVGGPPTVVCALCKRPVPQHAAYVVRIDVFADPAMPPLGSEEWAATDFDESMSDLMQPREGMSEEDLQDDVHRRFEYHVCRPCQRLILANPLGKPRKVRAGTN
jgi:hypothetical protein